MSLTTKMIENIADIRRYLTNTAEELEKMAWAFEPNSEDEKYWLKASDDVRAVATRIEKLLPF